MADKKITELSVLATITADDIFPIVDSPSGVPVTKKVTAAVLATYVAGTTDITTPLGLKAPLASPTFTGTVSGITKTMVGLGNADDTSDADKPVSTARQTALDLKANLASPTFTGTVGGITKTMVGLGNADDTSDADKPVSTATQTALDLKANLASPTFTGTVGGITKTMVGLSAVDNTSDADKPVSTATQTALDLKANLASPVLVTPTWAIDGTTGAAPTIASAATIAPTTRILFVSGTTTIDTITAPTGISAGGGQITIIPTGAFSTSTSGNIALVSTAVVNKALIMIWDVTTALWYPSY